MRPPPPPLPAPHLLGLLALLLPAATATFTLSHPIPFGSHSTSQSQPPCGASSLLLGTTTGFYVGGDSVAVVSAGDGASILIRATIGDLGSANWTNLFPVVAQRGGGKFCEPLVPAPVEWAGLEGVVQVIESGEEGLSYQCAPVAFRATRSGSVITLCSNGTDVTGLFASDPRLPSDGLPMEVSTAINLSAPTETVSGLAPGETAPETGGGEGTRAGGVVLVGVLGAGVLAAALLS